MFTLPHPVYP
jgi:hypothetical protein